MHADAILLCSEAELILISAICSTSQTHFILHYKPLWKTVTLGKQHITQTNVRERQWVLYDLLFSPPTERRDGEKDTRGGKPHATHRCCLSQLPSMHHACRTYGVPLKLAPHGILSINVVSCWKKNTFFPTYVLKTVDVRHIKAERLQKTWIFKWSLSSQGRMTAHTLQTLIH